jgi:hypothetical protein
MKSGRATRGISFYITITLAAAFALNTSCAKKEAPQADVRAMATFVIGTVTLERAGEPARAVKHKEELKQGDTVRTGPDSMLVIQIGEDSVIKIESRTILSLAQFLGKGDTRFNLEQGRMFTRIHHLSKESTFRVYTKTSLAAVRGTEFSVTSRTNETVVAVNDGTVAVQKVSPGTETRNEKPVEKGNAAVVSDTIKTRPVNAEEKKEFNRFAKITPIENLDEKSDSDLKQMEDEYQKNKDKAEDPEKKKDQKKDNKEDKDKNKKADEKASAQDKSAGSDTDKKTILWTDKSVYGPSDTIVVHYKDMPEYRTCWIDISNAADRDGRYRSYQWTYSAKNGQMSFAGMSLEPGVYEVRAHFGRSSSVDKRFRFQVK